MLGGQYYGLIYTKDSKESLIVYDENEETKNGNNVFIRKKLKIIGIFTMKIMMVKKI